jgi:dipeptidyl aminopeptidase/acylaminoacyl peptidase
MIKMIAQAILILVVVFIAFVAFVSYRLIKPPREISTWTPKDLGFDYKEFWLKTRDNLKLHAWWIDQGNEKTIIPLHGYTASKWNETYMKPIIEILLKAGYNLLVFDFRTHGRSEGKYTTIGDKELIDLISAVEWLKENYPKKAKRIGLIGYSMGGIVTIRALAEDKRINVGIADSPPVYIDKTGARGIKYFAGLPTWFYLFIKPLSRIISRGKEIDMMEYANKIKKPLLLIAGEKDPLVLQEEIREFYEQNKKINPNIELWITNANHVRTIQIAKEEYEKRILEFFERWL